MAGGAGRKLTDEQVEEARRLYAEMRRGLEPDEKIDWVEVRAAGLPTISDLARRYGVAPQTLHTAIHREPSQYTSGEWGVLDHAAIVKAYLSGQPVSDIAIDYGTGTTTIYDTLRRRGVKPNRASASKRYPAQRAYVAAVVADYRAGIKKEAIAQRYRVSLSTISRIIAAHGLSRRPRRANAAAVIADYCAGLPIKEIMQRQQIWPSTITHILAVNRIPRQRRRRNA